MGIKIGDKVVAHKDVVERATSMNIDISGKGKVEQLKDTGMSTEQALVSFPNYRCWIYTNEISIAFGKKEAYRDLETFEEKLGRKLTASERASFIESHKSDEFQKLIEDIQDRLYKAGVPNVHAIMSHVEESLKHWGIDWKLREEFK